MQKRFLKILILFVAIANTPSSHADIGTELRTSPLLRSTAFRAVQLRLCHDYRPRDERAACLKAGSALRALISFSTPFSPEEQTRLATALEISKPEASEVATTAIHTDRLEILLRDAGTEGYLKDLAFYHQYDAPGFNLWDSSVKLSTSPDSALERIAVLFQDLSQSREQLHWAIAKGIPDASIENLIAAIEPLIIDLKIGFKGANHSLAEIEKFYPAIVGKTVPDSLTPGVYHFYSAAYWTFRMRSLGFSRRDSILHAFGVHLAYEISSQNQDLWPLGQLPEKLNSLYKAQDLASAYWGAVFGAAMADHTAFPGESGLAVRLQDHFRITVRSLLK